MLDEMLFLKLNLSFAVKLTPFFHLNMSHLSWLQMVFVFVLLNNGFDEILQLELIKITLSMFIRQLVIFENDIFQL